VRSPEGLRYSVTQPGETAVCEKCGEIDAIIARYEGLRYERLKALTVDKVFLAGLDEVLRNLRADKIALHPEEK
jgi:hypothetical protein